VKVQRKGEKLKDIKADAVVLACGGFEYNNEMVDKYIRPDFDVMIMRGPRWNTGDGVVMAMKVGAKTDWMGDLHSAVEHADTPYVRGGMTNFWDFNLGIMVNKSAKRFCNEGLDYTG